jgi:LuxR family maltose regulon positive regulatory protein
MPKTLAAPVTSADVDAQDPARVAARHPLVESKLHPPAPAAGTIERPRLLVPLLEGIGQRFVALVAGPGYGKTTLLAQWAAAAREPVAWLTVDDLDNDPVVLLTNLEAAFARATQSAGDTPDGPPERRASHDVARVLDRMHASRVPVVLLLDDVHRLTKPAGIDALVAIADHLPPGFRLAMAARREPALPLARWRASRQLLDLDESQLALDEAETAAVVSAAGWTVGSDDVRSLLARTEGWAAATYLAALAHGRQDAAPSAVTPVTGRDRFIAAYLASEIRSGLTPEDAELLARTSVLDTVTPEAAIAITGDESAPLRLRSIARRNVLVHEAGGGATAYRYHHLLREFLLEDVDRDRPGATRALHARAAAWYASEGSHELAVEHALLAGDAHAASRQATGAILSTLYSGRAATVDRWLGSFDDAAYRGYPPLAALAAWSHLVTGRADEADRMADIVEAADFEGPSEDGALSFASHRAMLHALMCRHGVAEALANAELAAELEAGTRWRTNALWLLGSLRWLAGDTDEAEATLAQATSAAPIGASATAVAKRAAIRLRAGDWRGADLLATEGLRMLRASRWDIQLSAFYMHAVAARVAIARGDAATGRAELVRAQVVRPTASHGTPWFSVDALLELARAYLAVSDPAGARTALREAEAIIRMRPGLGVLVGELVDVRRRTGGAADALAGSSTLTSAELRVLPLLPTYLSFQDIADRLGISRNTVKTHAMSIYGKLWASSRGEAVERAVELGLLEPYPGLDRMGATGPDSGSGGDAADTTDDRAAG